MKATNTQNESPAQAPSLRGFYVMPRGWRDSFKPPAKAPLDEAAAYEWLVQKAAYRPRFKKMKVNGKSRAIPLATGDLCGGGRFLAAQWGWNYPRARRHLAWLEKLGMISTRVEQDVSVITVCRYEEIQRGSWPFANYGEDAGIATPPPASEPSARSGADSGAEETVISICNRLPKPVGTSKNGAGSSAGSGAPLTSTNQLNHKEESHKNLRDSRSEASDEWDEFWNEYPRKVGKDAARKAYAAARKRGAEHAEIMTGLRHFSWSPDPKFRPHPASWLSAGRWKDEPEPAKQPPDPNDSWGIQAWCIKRGFEPACAEDREKGKGRWLSPDRRSLIDVVARMVAEAARLPRSWRGDWDLLAEWLEVVEEAIGRDFRRTPGTEIERVIRERAKWNGYEPARIVSLKYFDSLVRALAA